MVHGRLVEIPVDFLYVADGFVAEIAAAQPDGVDTGIGDGITSYLDVGRNILVNKRTALYHHMCADVAELVNEGTATDNGIVVDIYFAGHLRGV